SRLPRLRARGVQTIRSAARAAEGALKKFTSKFREKSRTDCRMGTCVVMCVAEEAPRGAGGHVIHAHSCTNLLDAAGALQRFCRGLREASSWEGKNLGVHLGARLVRDASSTTITRHR